MAKPLLEKHAKAIEFRRKGRSYSQIKKKLQVSKSTLSLWLREYPLSEKRIQQLQGRSGKRIESFRKTMQRKRDDRLKKVYLEEKKILLPLTKRELYLTGLFLYWGEGLKASSAMVSVSNSDPQVMKFFVYWLTKILDIPKSILRVRLHLYKDMDIDRKTMFWSKKLKIPSVQFNKPHIKETTLKSLTYKNFGHGTCAVTIGGVEIKNRIIMGIKAISDYYGSRI